MGEREVIGTYRTPDGDPIPGAVLIGPNVRVVDPDGNAIYPAGLVRAEVDITGTVTFPPLVTTDTPGLLPVGWKYRVYERIANTSRSSFLIELPEGEGPLELDDVVPVSPAPPTGSYTPATLTAKGDILTRTASGYARLPVGESGRVLSADPGAPTGLAWVSPSSGGGEGGFYAHTQASPATTWTIDHGLGYRPNVAVEDTDGNSLDVTVQWPTVNRVLVLFGPSTAGKAYLS